MARKRQLCLLFAFLFIMLLGGFAYGYEFGSRELFAVDDQHPEYVSGEILVGFKPGTPGDAKYKIHERCGAMAAYPNFGGRFEKVKFGNGKSVEEMIAKYEREPDVSYAEPNYIAHALFVPNDPLYSFQWHFHSPADAPGGANLERAWDISTGKNVIVAVVDSGVAYEDYEDFRQASDLAGVSFVPGYDFVDHDNHPNDELGHGTHVAGIIAQRTNNSMGAAGAAFDCSIMPIRVLDEDGYGTHSAIVDGVDFAVENGAKVINLSLGSDQPSISLMLSLSIAHDKGVTLVAAGGNEYLFGSPPSYPAAYDAFSISVAAVRYDGRRAWYSTMADYIDLAAPGGDLSVDQNRDNSPDGVLQQSFVGDPQDIDYFFGEGTSFAAPHVSAVAAMLISHGLTDPDVIAEVLTLSARDKGKPGWDTQYGHGILDAHVALKYATKMTITEREESPSRNGKLNIRAYLRDRPGNETSEGDTQSHTSSLHDFASKLDADELPGSTELHQNYPNPFNAETWIPFQIKEDARVLIKIYTPTGQLVRTLDLGRKPAGFYINKDMAAYWDGRNRAGESLTSKVYFYSIKAGDFSAIRKMVIKN